MGYNTNWMFEEQKICPTCNTLIENPRDNQVYCNQKCYSKSPKLKEQAKKSSLIKSNSEMKWHKGHKHSEETKQKIRENTPKRIGIDNPIWKGDEVGYCALHDWVRKNKLPSKICQVCERTRCRIEAANISGEYKREVHDFIWLCCRCHTKFDNIKKMNGYQVIGVESKVNGYLDKEEKEKCEWLLKNKIFSKILIASKTKVKNRIVVKYKEFKCPS